MSKDKTINYRIVFNSRPRGAPTVDNLRLKKNTVGQSSVGQVLLHTSYLSNSHLVPNLKAQLLQEVLG